MHRVSLHGLSRGRRPSLPPAMRHTAFRLWWLGNTGSVIGSMMWRFAQLWLIHDLTGSPLWLGYVGLANSVPAISLIMVGGVVADKVNKRRLIVITQFLGACLFLSLAIVTALGVVEPWHVLVVSAFMGVTSAFDWPARESFYPRLVDRDAIMSAVALDSTTNTMSQIAAPIVAGLITAKLGNSAPLFVATGGFLIMSAFVSRIVPTYTVARSEGRASRQLFQGLAFIREHSIFTILISMTFFISFFGSSYYVLMPVFATEHLGVGAQGLGLLTGAGGVGAMITSVWLGSMGGAIRRGPMLVVFATLFGLSVAAFGLTSEFVGFYPLALTLMFANGTFRVLYSVSIVSSIQMMVPDDMRGRVMGVHAITYLLLPLGGMQAGALANFFGAPVAAAIGGLVVAAFAPAMAKLVRGIRDLDRLVRESGT